MSDNNLAALPTELLHNILSYSIWNTPDESREPVAVTTGRKPELWTNHIYYTVAATSRHLRDVVESFCRHLIILHKSTTKLQPPAKKSKNPTPNRVRWVKWTAKHCIFCGKETTCMALMYSSVRCCRKCDKKEWPDKITMTAALNNYNLTKLDLFTPNPLYPENPFPVLRFGIYNCMGVYTTMFMKDEVEERARLIHGNNSAKDQKARKSHRTKIENSMKMSVVGGRWVQPRLSDIRDVESASEFDTLRSGPSNLGHYSRHKEYAQCCGDTGGLHALIQHERAGVADVDTENG